MISTSEAYGLVFGSLFGVLLLTAAVGVGFYAVKALQTEKAKDMIWTPLSRWVGAHPLMFRTALVALGCFVVGRFIWWLAWAGLILWAALLIWRYWREPWVLPAWRWLCALFFRVVFRARPYRYPGESEAHAEQARQTGVALGLMASADASPEQIRMASEIEDDAERRLGVLLGKAQLSLEEKRERDAIQLALQRRRQSFDAPRPQGFLSGLAAAPVFGGITTWIMGGLAAWGLSASGWAWIQTQRADHFKDELTQAESQADEQARAARGWREQYARTETALIAARQQSAASVETIETERRRARERAREQERMRDAIRQVDSGGGPPDWSLGVRDAGSGPGSGAGGSTDSHSR